MKVSLILAVLLISLAFCEEPETKKQPTQISLGKEEDKDKGRRNPWKRDAGDLVMHDEICKEAGNVLVKSVFVDERLTQFFIQSMDGSRGWTSYTLHIWPRSEYIHLHSSGPRKLTNFEIMGVIQDSQEQKNDANFTNVSASYLLFSNSGEAKPYLVVGLSAYEFIHTSRYYYRASGKVKAITDFFKEDQKKLLMPEDKLEEVVSVALIKWVDKHKIKDHAIYKIILKTMTKKLVKAYFKVTSKDEVISMNSEPFVPSAELMQDEDEFNLHEESAMYYVKELNKLSMGYQFIKTSAFPIYYDYNPDNNTYKEYPMRTKEGFNAELEKIVDKIPYRSRYIVPTETWLGCPETTFCLGRPFDAVFRHGNKYYAIFESLLYTLPSASNRPGFFVDLLSIFPPQWHKLHVDAAFTFGDMVFFFQNHNVYYKIDFGDVEKYELNISEVFPGIRASEDFPVSAVITLDKRKEASENSGSIVQPSKLTSARNERAAETTENMAYVYFSDKDGGKVYQYEMETKEPPKFKLIANKTYNEVNEALAFPVSLVFTADGKVVTMIHHFMIEQSSKTFFTQTENAGKFSFINKYFGCSIENLENELSKEFVQNYVEFAGPKPGVNVFADPYDKQDSETASPPPSLSTEWVIIIIIIVIIIFISIITGFAFVGFVIWRHFQRKRQPEPQNKETLDQVLRKDLK